FIDAGSMPVIESAVRLFPRTGFADNPDRLPPLYVQIHVPDQAFAESRLSGSDGQLLKAQQARVGHIGRTLDEGSSSAAARVEQIAQGIPKQIEPDYRQTDGDPRKQRNPPFAGEDVVARVGKHCA